MNRQSLKNCQLFEGMPKEQIDALLEQVNYELRTYSAKEVIVPEGNRLSHLMILTAGVIMAETSDANNSSQQIERIEAPSLIAPCFLFSKEGVLPTTIMAHTMVDMLVIGKTDFARLMQKNMMVLQNFMGIISAQNSFISDGVVYLTYKTIISKLANYLLNLMNEQKSTKIINPKTQQQMAEMFGVTRPALARTIGELVKEGTIYVKGKQIKILFSEKLAQHAKK